MRKIIACALCLLLALALTACGGAAEETSEAARETMAPVTPAAAAAETPGPEGASASEAESPVPAAVPDEEELPASASDAAVDEEAFAAAEDCVGQSVEALYEAVGEPTGGAQYAASCLEENAEDGMLFYDELGFYVWTVRSETQEIVHAVYPLD